MNTSSDRDYTSSNNSKVDQKPPMFNSSNVSQHNASNFDSVGKGHQTLFERSSLKNLSNDELEKLIQQKTQAIEKIQTSSFSNNNRSAGLSLASPSRKIGNPNVNQILSKYNLTPSNEDKMAQGYLTIENKFNSTNIFETSEAAPVQDTPGFASASVSNTFDTYKKELKPISKVQGEAIDTIKDPPLNINVVENPYLSNLESSIERTEQSQPRNARDIDIMLFNQEFGTSRDYQIGSPTMLSSPVRLPVSGKSQNKENIIKTLGVGQTTPKQSGIPKPARGSPAIAGAMKALQDKLENSEAEIIELKKKLNDATGEKHKEIEEQRRKMLKELESRQEREDELMRTIEKQNGENFQLENELARIKMTNETNEEQIQSLKAELMKFREDCKTLQQDNSVMKKEVLLVENEKNFHLEQNANDRDSYERKIEELMSDLGEEKEKRIHLDKYKEEAEAFRAEAEDELRRITDELATLRKQNKERIKTLEHQLDEAVKQNQEYAEEYSTAVGKHEKEKALLQKKLEEFERKIESVVTNYEEKLDTVKEENRELKKIYNTQQNELSSLQKRVAQLEKDNKRFENDKAEKEKLIKQIMEINDDLVRKIKKDPNDTVLQNILFKKKKIEQELQSKKNEKAITKKVTNSGRKKSISRSPSAKKSARKDHLSVEDLNQSRDSASETPRATSKKRKLSGSQGSKQASPRPSKGDTSLKSSLGHDNPPKPQKSTARSLSRRDKPSTREDEVPTRREPLNIRTYKTEDPISSYDFTGILGVPGTAPHESGKKMIGSVTSNVDFGFGSKLENSSVQSNRPVKLDSDVEKMSSNQISTEVVKIEREISELKREYKNLLAKAQSTTTENPQEVKARLSQVANELQERSEVHLLIKKKQRELLSKNL